MSPIPPITIFAYRRRGALMRLMNSLSRCAGVEDHAITVFVDGPRGPADGADVEAVRRALTSLDWPNLAVRASPVHRGLKVSVHAGVSAMLARHASVIVLEDDLELAPGALTFFRTALEVYRHHPEVLAISGHAYDLPALRDHKEAVALPCASSWGWATWARAWDGFTLDPAHYRALLASRQARAALDKRSVVRAGAMLDLEMRGLIDSWWILWSAHMAQRGGCAIAPPVTLVRNTGHAAPGASHSSAKNPFGRRLAKIEAHMPMLERPERLCFPAPEIDWRTFARIRAGAHARAHRHAADLGRWRRKLAVLAR